MMQSYGQAPPTPPLPGGELAPPGGTGQLSVLEQRDGKFYWKPEARKGALDLLSGMRVVHVGGPVERVTVQPLSPDELAALQTPDGQQMIGPFLADQWVEDRVSEGKVVLAPIWLFAPVAGRELAAIPASEKGKIEQAASTDQVGILAEPTGWLPTLSAGTIALAAGLAVAGIGYVYYRKKKG